MTHFQKKLCIQIELKLFSIFSYKNVNTGEIKTVMYKNQEDATVEQIKILGDDLGNDQLNAVCFVLRVAVSTLSIYHGCQVLSPKWVRFAPNGTNPRLIRSEFCTFCLG